MGYWKTVVLKHIIVFMNMNILRTICIATELNIVFFYTSIELYPEGQHDLVVNVVGIVKNICYKTSIFYKNLVQST